MNFNPHYAESLGRELQRDRRREAERERLLRMVSTPADPPGIVKVWFVFRERWDHFWTGVLKSSKVLSGTSPSNKSTRL